MAVDQTHLKKINDSLTEFEANDSIAAQCETGLVCNVSWPQNGPQKIQLVGFLCSFAGESFPDRSIIPETLLPEFCSRLLLSNILIDVFCLN